MKKNIDTIIIGGGIVGLSCAYYLQKEGVEVAIIEKGAPKDACSHANCGLVSPSHALPLNSPELMMKAMKWLFQSDSPFYIRPQLDANFISWMLGFGLNARADKVQKAMEGRNNLMLSSKALFKDIIKEENIDCNWSDEGIMFAFESEKAFDKHAAINRRLTDLDMQLMADPMVGDALYQKEPALSENVHGGWWYRFDASIKPDLMVAGLKKALKQKGVQFFEETEVVGFESANYQITGINTNRGDFKAKNIVLATGAWSPKVVDDLDLKIPIVPGKGYSITMKSPGFSPKMPCIMEEKKVVATPWNGSYRLGGTMEFAGYNTELNKVRFNALKKAANIYLRDPYTDDVLEHWYGWRPMTNNGLPIIDHAPKYRNMLMACGHNMLGLSMGPATGKLVSEILTAKETHIDPSYYALRGNFN